MEYIQAMDRADLNVMSEFLVNGGDTSGHQMQDASSKGSHEEGEEEDPRQELVEQLCSTRCTNTCLRTA